MWYIPMMFGILFGALVVITGMISFAIRRKKRKSNPEERYKDLKKGGIILIVVGIMIMTIFGTAMFCLYEDYDKEKGKSIITCLKEEIYYNTFAFTKDVIEGTEFNHSDEGFYYQGKHYTLVGAMTVQYKDEYRGKAVARLKDSKATVFRYNHPSGSDMLCAMYGVYCSDEDMDELSDYYSKGEFKYEISYYESPAYDIETEMEISNDLFFHLYKADSSKMKLAIEEHDKVEEDETPETTIWLTQHSMDGRFSRTLAVDITSENDIYVLGRTTECNSPEEIGERGNVYLITDQKLKEEVFALREQVKR